MIRKFGIRFMLAAMLGGVPMPLYAQSTTPPADQTLPPAAPVTEVQPTAKPAPKAAPKPVKKGPVDSLKPGQFIWEKHDAYEGPLKIVAVLDIQRLYVFQNDKLIGFTTISAGKKGKETPTGYFNILQKNVDHKSNLYSNAPMPYMQRLTWDGIALHGGHIPGYPASHGCIRMPKAFAKSLFELTQLNQEVVVLQNTATPVKRPEPAPVVPVEPTPNTQPLPSEPQAAPPPAGDITPPRSPATPAVPPTSTETVPPASQPKPPIAK